MNRIKTLYDRVVIIIAKWLCENIDKVLHAIVSMVITILLSIFLPVWVGGLATLAIGIGKEVYDYADYQSDWKDLIADIIGIGAILLFYYSKI